MPRIQHIIVHLETRDARYHGFRLTRCRDGRTVEAQAGTENNIRFALTHDGRQWRSQHCHWSTQTITERELFALPNAGSDPAGIRAWVAKEFRKRKPKSA